MNNQIQRLDDLRLQSMNLRVECDHCGHYGIVDGPKLWRWFAVHRWDSQLIRVGEHMRCGACAHRPARLSPTADAPSIDFGPQTDAEWKTVVARLR